MCDAGCVISHVWRRMCNQPCVTPGVKPHARPEISDNGRSPFYLLDIRLAADYVDYKLFLCSGRDSNLWLRNPLDLEADALPIEPPRPPLGTLNSMFLPLLDWRLSIIYTHWKTRVLQIEKPYLKNKVHNRKKKELKAYDFFFFKWRREYCMCMLTYFAKYSVPD